MPFVYNSRHATGRMKRIYTDTAASSELLQRMSSCIAHGIRAGGSIHAARYIQVPKEGEDGGPHGSGRQAMSRGGNQI